MAVSKTYRFYVEVVYCDFCGGWCGRRGWALRPRFRFQCRNGCSTIPAALYPSYECWRQTGHWRFNHHDYRAVAPPGPSDPYVFQLDAARCDFCADRGTEAVWTGFPLPADRNDAAIWLMACAPCRDRWEADHEEDHGFASLEIKKEPPEFPVYIGWDGQEHGEF